MKKQKYIYVYETPESKKSGLVKIGETTRENVRERIEEQINTAATFNDKLKEYNLIHKRLAIKENGKTHTDKDFHKFLVRSGVQQVEKKEWFKINPEQVINALDEFQKGEKIIADIKRVNSFPMRKEQEEAVNITFEYFNKNINKVQVSNFLWNAKMRFGKTFSSYQLMKKSNWKNVLIATYKPAVRRSWEVDLNTHKDFLGYNFLCDEDILKYKEDEYNVFFVSFQDLLFSKNNLKEKHKILFNINWDCVIIDEFHYGTSTENAKNMFCEYYELDDKNKLSKEKEFVNKSLKKIKTKNRLYLSGTPFKAIGGNEFSEEQIYNWTYIDEQKAKEEFGIDGEGNPYYSLPKINFYIYEISDKNFEIAMRNNKNEFSLNHFFEVDKNNKFKRENDVLSWLKIICGAGEINDYDDFLEENKEIKKSEFPFASNSGGGLFDVLRHTLWLMPNVKSCFAMAELLKKDSVFSDFKVVVAAGNKYGVGSDAVPPVEKAIRENKRTITLSCGKLTEGVSIKEWTGVLFLSDIKSPEKYFQAAFRAQTPWREDGVTIKKDCYVFDFHPSRCLSLIYNYSSSLDKDKHKNKEDERESVRNFIKYLPILRARGNTMKMLNDEDIYLSINSNFKKLDGFNITKSFQLSKNFNLTNENIMDLISNNEISNYCDSILDKIKSYKKFVNTDDDLKAKKTTTIDLKDFGDINKRLEALKTKNIEELNEEEEKIKSDLEKKREQIQSLLKVLMGRIPLFMYLTHAQEYDIEEVIRNNQSYGYDSLFRKTTGIEIEDFVFLINIGLIVNDEINWSIKNFHKLEVKNYIIDNKLIMNKFFN